MSSKPVVYTIAGSDCSGGAGIQADILTLHNLGVHTCTLTTALTAQNQSGIASVLPTSEAQLRAEFHALLSDLPPTAIKIGMLATAALVATVQELLEETDCPVICDPVMSASAGGELLTPEGRESLRRLFPALTLLTPNAKEAELLTGLSINNYADMETAAEALLQMGVHAVLITGGDLAYQPSVRCDYFASQYERFWLQSDTIVTPHTHGTGCSFASAVAAFLAKGKPLPEAIVQAKMVVSDGLRRAQTIGGHRGAVAHPRWSEVMSSGLDNLPRVLHMRPDSFTPMRFASCAPLGLYPVVGDVAWIEKLLPLGVRTIQLRLKQQPEPVLRKQIQQAVSLQRQYDAQLFINDYWELAIEYGAYGVHLGQEDLAHADLKQIADAGLRLGTSNHSWYELARSHPLNPSYIALGPIYSTTTKVMRFAPQGLQQLDEWVKLLRPHYPLTAIGGIDLQRAPSVLATGVGSVAVVRAVTEAPDYAAAVNAFHRLIEDSHAHLS